MIDEALGVWYGEEETGDAAGEEYSRAGLVTRFGPDTVVALKADRSSSDVEFISTSLSSDDRKEGCPVASLSIRAVGDSARWPFIWRLGPAIEDDASGRSSTRRVRGRFNFRSGSAGG